MLKSRRIPRARRVRNIGLAARASASILISSALATSMIGPAQAAPVPAGAATRTATKIADATPRNPASYPGIDTSQIDPGPLPPPSALIPQPQNRAAGGNPASQCQWGRWAARGDDAANANAIMAGAVKLVGYGTLSVRKNPTWRYQSSLDSSGNGHMHSLFWALPLLRTGLKTGNQAMVDRFYYLVRDWIRDNPIRRPRQGAAYGQIETGFRLLTFACALAGPAPNPALIAKSMTAQAKYSAARWRAINNASFHAGSGILATGCSLNRGPLIQRGLSFMSRMSDAMIAADGSVREGATDYARDTYAWTQHAIARVAACGQAIPEPLSRSSLIPNFLTQAVRPDGKYEALGDSSVDRAVPSDAPADSTLKYASTAGAQGTNPGTVYAPFSAGFIFARSGWGTPTRPFGKETFYSLRTGPGSAYEYHAHNDAGALTLASQGSQLLFDTGIYRYGGGDASWFVRTRAAHNTVLIRGVPSGAPRPTVTASYTSGDGDFTSINDAAYVRSSIQRSVWYDRAGDFFVVMDDVSTRKPRYISQNWNLGRDRTVTVNGAAAATAGSGANVSIISVGDTPDYSVLTGSRNPWRGWNSAAYGELSPSPSLGVQTATRVASARLVTVIVPRDAETPETAVSATGQLDATGAALTVNKSGIEYRLAISSSGVARLS